MAAISYSKVPVSTTNNVPYDMGFEENVVVLYKPKTNDPYASFEYKNVQIVTSQNNKTSLTISKFFEGKIKNKEALKNYCLSLKDLKVDLHSDGRFFSIFLEVFT